MNIKELAEQAGFDIEKTMYGERVYVDGRGITDLLERFAELVAAAERESCARLVEEVGRQTAAAIRARGEK